MATIGRGAAVIQMPGGRTMKGKAASSPGAPSISLSCPPARIGPRRSWTGRGPASPTSAPAGSRWRPERNRRVTIASTAVELARWQFALTTLYHFTFVPLTLGLAPLLAVMQTLWHRTGDEKWLRMTRFFGTLFLINFAIGVATGLVHGVSVRHELGHLLELCRRRLRLAARDRGPRGVHARGDLHRALGLRLGPALAEGSPRDHLPRLARHLALGVLHPGGELLDAAPGRLRDQLADESRGGERHRQHPHPGVRALRLDPRDPGRAAHRRLPGARRVLLAPAPRQERRSLLPARRSSRSSSFCPSRSSSWGSGASSASP